MTDGWLAKAGARKCVLPVGGHQWIATHSSRRGGLAPNARDEGNPAGDTRNETAGASVHLLRHLDPL